ncbi:MAG TPA: ABC transporter permease [Candidatus Dormibacteraeota bacterium]|nr:ABC transporter permease [Candidatus Dormibacteraeota bacterium]
MSTYALSDAATMLRRDFRHLRRYPVMTISGIVTPTVMLLLFVFVFGGAMSSGMGGNASYVNYLVPGILLMTLGSGCAATAVGVNMDMTEGVVARFRIMAISRASVLTGRVVGSMIRTLIGVVLVIGVALIAGFRPTAGPVQWLAAFGFIALLTLALTWLAVALGMVAKSPEGANGSTLLLQFVGPFISSAFVRPETMPVGVRWFAENQPFTSMIETLRGLLLGTPIGNHAIVALAWCVAIALGGYLWARVSYNRDPIR